MILVLNYLTGFSGFLSGTSYSGRLWFILLSVSTSVLINGHKDFCFIFAVFIHPISQVNRTAGEIVILGT